MSRGGTLKVKTRNVAQEIAVWRRSIGNFFEYSERFSEHGIFHGFNSQTNKLVIDIKLYKWLVNNRVGVTEICKS